MTRQVYTIYCHEDTDGGIAAAIFAQHILQKYGAFGWVVDIVPVAHALSAHDWSCREISLPCAILDFNLHAQFLNERSFKKNHAWARKLGGTSRVPPCAWIDHHPTGPTFSVLSAENIAAAMPEVLVKWDTNSISTPGLLRTHHKELGIDLGIIQTWEQYIDIAEIVDGALYATASAAHDFHSPAVRVQTLFSTEHPLIHKEKLLKQLVNNIMHQPNPEKLFECDSLYPSILQYEREQHLQRAQCYNAFTTRSGNVALSNFMRHAEFPGLSRFLPYTLFPDVEYAIHVLPLSEGVAPITCGINPWKKPKDNSKHLGNYFAEYFSGGGHSFVAGGKIHEEDLNHIEDLISFLTK
jgi:hypothetical protein